MWNYAKFSSLVLLGVLSFLGCDYNDLMPSKPKRNSRPESSNSNQLQDVEQKYQELVNLEARITKNRRLEKEELRKIRNSLTTLKGRLGSRSTTNQDLTPSGFQDNSLTRYSDNNNYSPNRSSSTFTNKSPGDGTKPLERGKYLEQTPNQHTVSAPFQNASIDNQQGGSQHLSDASIEQHVPADGSGPTPPPFLNSPSPKNINSSRSGQNKRAHTRASTGSSSYLPVSRINNRVKPIAVDAIPRAKQGRVLQVKGIGASRTATLDIGNSAGIKVGSLVSMGGVGEGCTVWKVISTRNFTSEAQPLPNQGKIYGATGKKIVQVKRSR